jgi:hypothetical protein
MTVSSSDDGQLLVVTLREYYEKKDPAEVRGDLEQKYGTVWDDKELLENFGVQFFDGPIVHVISRDNGASGTVGFIDKPRLYFAFIPDQQQND